MHILLCFTFLRDEKSKNKSWRSSQLFQEAQKGKPVVQEFLPMIWINTRQRPHASAKSAWALLTDQQTAVCSPEIQDEICRELGVEGWGLLWAKQAGKGGVRHRNEGNVQMAVGRGVNHRQMLQEQHHLAHKNEMLIFFSPLFSFRAELHVMLEHDHHLFSTLHHATLSSQCKSKAKLSAALCWHCHRMESMSTTEQ